VANQLGLPISDIEFVRLAGVIEILFGLLLISGALPQVIILIAGVPFNATLWFFGVNELLGHLPIYGAMLVILVFGSDPNLRGLVYRFRFKSFLDPTLSNGPKSGARSSAASPD
jgi:hypothetical protein